MIWAVAKVISPNCCQKKFKNQKFNSLHEKCLYSELFWSAFFLIWTEYGEILRISPYSVRMRENADQNNSEYGRFLRSESSKIILAEMYSPLNEHLFF